MNLEQLPQEFLERMEHMLGEEYPAFYSPMRSRVSSGCVSIR